jgi:CRP/FNR family transcriptional regulator
MQNRPFSTAASHRVSAVEARAIALGVDRKLAAAFQAKGTMHRLAAHQALSVQEQNAHVLVLSGVLAVATAIRATEDQIVALLFPGDILATRVVAPLPRVRVFALGSAEVIRGLGAELEDEAPEESCVHDRLIAHTEDLWTRAAAHALAIAGLPAEERVIALIVEFGTRLGRFQGQRVSVMLPLQRTDMASYLALNPDTLSRTLSRIKKAGLIQFSGRRDLTIPDWTALCAATSLANTIIKLNRHGTAAPVVPPLIAAQRQQG